MTHAMRSVGLSLVHQNRQQLQRVSSFDAWPFLQPQSARARQPGHSIHMLGPDQGLKPLMLHVVTEIDRMAAASGVESSGGTKLYCLRQFRLKQNENR